MLLTGQAKVGRTLLLSCLLWLALAGCKSSPPVTTGDGGGEAAVNVEDPETCAACHGTIVSEWKQSMHALAHHDRDPIYAGIRRMRMKKEGEGTDRACALCHTPRDPQVTDGPAGQVGVACAACHNVARVQPGHGHAALVPAAAGLLLGPNDVTAEATPAHGTGAAPAHMKDGVRLCLACHSEMKSPKTGVPICTTGPEADDLKEEGQTCADCHMTRVAGPPGTAGARKEHADHTFPGPHRAWYQDDRRPLEEAVGLSGQLAAGKLTVQLENLTGHSFPTGFPGRAAVLKAVGFDAAGKEVWRSWRDDALKESPDSLLHKRYVDAEGKPTLAPYAAKLQRDTRLRPGETRSIELAPPEEVVRVEATLLMFLVPKQLAAKIGLTDRPEAKPKPAASATFKR